MLIPGTNLASTDCAGIRALKVRVNVVANEHFGGLACAGRFWPEGVTEAVLDSDPGATGTPIIDEETARPLPIFTLEGKLCQFYTLEGRRRIGESPRGRDWHRWSEPRFPLPDTSGKDPSKQAAPLRAKSLLRLEILDRQLANGTWESENKTDLEKPAKPTTAATSHSKNPKTAAPVAEEI